MLLVLFLFLIGLVLLVVGLTKYLRACRASKWQASAAKVKCTGVSEKHSATAYGTGSRSVFCPKVHAHYFVGQEMYVTYVICIDSSSFWFDTESEAREFGSYLENKNEVFVDPYCGSRAALFLGVPSGRIQHYLSLIGGGVLVCVLSTILGLWLNHINIV